MNIPNIISLFRIIIVPFYCYYLLQSTPFMRGVALFLFILASVSDFLDGYLARKLNQFSEFGKFIDPLADKVLVIATLVIFLLIDPLIELWMVVVVVLRDTFVTWLRSVALKQGKSIRTSMLGKVKTAVQMVAIIVILLILIIQAHIGVGSYETAGLPVQTAFSLIISGKADLVLIALPYWLMLFVSLLTLASGLRYAIINHTVLVVAFGGRQKSEK